MLNTLHTLVKKPPSLKNIYIYILLTFICFPYSQTTRKTT